MHVNTKKLIVVVGPTAVGKTAMAIELAKAFDTEILSADSRQFYQEMSIGTAKPDVAELAQAKHHFIDSHSIAVDYSAGDFERDALLCLDKIFKTKDVAIMVGGSGLFVRAVTEGLDNLPKVPAEVRARLNSIFEKEGIAPLQAKLKAVDPIYYAKVDLSNSQRVIRALEIYEATGQAFSTFHAGAQGNRPFEVITIGLNMERAKLYERINRRVDIMMESGLLDEVKSLQAYSHKPALLTVGYAELFDYLAEKLTLAEAVDKIKQHSRQYAKRQITWFKKYGNTHWFEANDLAGILAFLA